jgi:ribokinase
MVIKTSHFPAPGETIIGGEFLLAHGGKGANQAVAAARMGGDVSFVCRLGKDVFGQNAFESYQKEGIDTSFIHFDGAFPTGVAQITVDEKGENTIIVAPGANMQLSTSDIDQFSSILVPSSIVLMQLECPLKTIEYTAKIACEKGAKVILNPAPARTLSEELMSLLYLITPNETEAYWMTGVKVTDEKSAARASVILLEKGVKHVIITMGAMGAYLHSEEYKGLIPGIKVQVVDTTAAGDTFNGTLAVQLAKGFSLKEAVKTANEAAALTVQKMGAQPAIPYLKDL